MKPRNQHKLAEEGISGKIIRRGCSGWGYHWFKSRSTSCNETFPYSREALIWRWIKFIKSPPPLVSMTGQNITTKREFGRKKKPKAGTEFVNLKYLREHKLAVESISRKGSEGRFATVKKSSRQIWFELFYWPYESFLQRITARHWKLCAASNKISQL